MKRHVVQQQNARKLRSGSFGSFGAPLDEGGTDTVYIVSESSSFKKKHLESGQVAMARWDKSMLHFDGDGQHHHHLALSRLRTPTGHGFQVTYERSVSHRFGGVPSCQIYRSRNLL